MLNISINYLFLFLIAFFVSIALAPLVIFLIKKTKAKQTINEYVDFHNKKQGTLSMGGIVFIVSIVVVSSIFISGITQEIFIAIGFILLFALVGFVDDFLKIKRKNNQGLSVLQKIVFQAIIGVGLSLYLYFTGYTFLNIPFTNLRVNIGVFSIIFSLLFSVFITNSANLADGLDGLDSSIAMIVTCLFGVFIALKSIYGNFENAKFVEMYLNFGNLFLISSGAIFGFLFFNLYPAKIFMGDTGSLAIGGIISVISLFTGDALYMLFFAIIFVITGLSSLIQVAYYKLTKKRIFLMAPLHHHFEMKGIHETKIVATYDIITIVVCFLVMFLEFVIL